MMPLPELAVVVLALVGLTISTFMPFWRSLFLKVSWLSMVPTPWRKDARSTPLACSSSGTRPDTSYPVFDKTPGDDPFVRDEFFAALRSLALQELGPVKGGQYIAWMLGLQPDNESLQFAMVQQQESRRSTLPTPCPSERSRSSPRPLTRQNAFDGASDPDTFFHKVWWLTPRSASASSSGPALAAWMRSIRIVKRYRATAAAFHGPADLEASWRACFNRAFPGFDILQPGEDASQSTRWPYPY